MRRLTRLRLLALILALPISGCVPSQRAAVGAEPFRAPEHAGVWESEGYGHVVVAAPDGVRLYHAAGDVCVEHPDGEPSVLDFLGLYRPTDGGRVLRLSSALGPSEYTFRRARSLPAPCLSPTPDTPAGNFDALAAYFDEHYAFFDLYGVEWSERTALSRAAVTDTMGDRALFDLTSDLLRPLEDSHVRIDAEVDGEGAVYEGRRGRTDVAVAERTERAGGSASEGVRSFRRSYWAATGGRTSRRPSSRGRA